MGWDTVTIAGLRTVTGRIYGCFLLIRLIVHFGSIRKVLAGNRLDIHPSRGNEGCIVNGPIGKSGRNLPEFAVYLILPLAKDKITSIHHNRFTFIIAVVGLDFQ